MQITMNIIYIIIKFISIQQRHIAKQVLLIKTINILILLIYINMNAGSAIILQLR